MATVSMSLLFQNPLISPYHSKTRPLPRNQSNWFQAPTSTRTKPTSSFSSIRAQSGTAARKEDIVIVGAGIAGLATALSLHRLGVGSLVLEQAESLRTGGTSLTLFKNGWRVLDAIGVGNDLRTQFLEIQGCAGWW